nr:hypothetical protein [uncultured Gemmiger sp.]
MSRYLTRAFSIGFAAVWGWVLLNSILRWPHNGPAAFLAGLALGFVAFFVVRFLLPYLDRVPYARFRRWMAVALLLYGLFLGRMGFWLAEMPIMDMKTVLQSLPDFLDDGVPQVWGAYYIICNNNLGLALVLVLWFRLAGLFGIMPDTQGGIYAGIVLNVLAITVSVALVCLLARRILKRNSGVALAFLLCVGFLPFVLWSPCFYSDTLCLPFALLVLLGWTHYRSATHTLVRLGWLTFMAAAAFTGYAIKGSVAVVLVAVIIQLFLERKVRQALAGTAALLLVFGMLLTGYRVWQRSFLDFSVEDAVGLPIELWFAYGSGGDGNYNDEVCQTAKSLATMDQRRQMLRQHIAAQYAARTPVGQADFLTRKAVITWGNGLYDAQEFLATPLNVNWTHRFILEGQPGYMPMVYYCQSYLYFVMVLILLGTLSAARCAVPGPLTMARVSVFGLMLFLSFWETKARYAFQFTPLLLLLAAAALWQLTRVGPPGNAPLREPAMAE